MNKRRKEHQCNVKKWIRGKIIKENVLLKDYESERKEETEEGDTEGKGEGQRTRTYCHKENHK